MDSLTSTFFHMGRHSDCNLSNPLDRELNYKIKVDSLSVSEHPLLWETIPDEHNHYEYVEFAKAYYRMGVYDKSEFMFQTILSSDLACYNQRVYYSTRGDFEVSYEPKSNYEESIFHKHSAAYYLSLINLQHKKYREAYEYALMASKQYPNGQACGTSQQFYTAETNGLMFECLYQLGEYQKIKEAYFDGYFICENEKITNVLLKLYTKEQLKDSMNKAVSTIRYTLSEPGTCTSYGNKGTSIHKTQSIDSKIFFMGHWFDLNRINYYDDAVPNPKDIIWELKKTYFYRMVYAN